MDSHDTKNKPKVYESGWRPEIAGAIGVAALLWFLISFATGIM